MGQGAQRDKLFNGVAKYYMRGLRDWSTQLLFTVVGLSGIVSDLPADLCRIGRMLLECVKCNCSVFPWP